MRKFILASLALAALSCEPVVHELDAQVATQASVDSLRADVAAIKAALGSFTVKPKVRSEGGAACTETPSGECQVFYSLREIRLAIDQLVANASKSTATPVSSSAQPASSPAVPTMPGLTTAQIAAVVQCLTDGVNSGYPIAATRDRVKSELAAGIYSYGVRSIIDDAKLWYYSGSAGANRSALYSYLAIIDQRDPNNPNETLAIGDPRWVKVGTGASSAAPASFASNTVNGDLYVTGRIIVGSCAHPDGNALVHVCGSGDGAIQLESGVGGSKPAIGMLSLGGDHGLRLLQNAYTSVNTHPAYDPVGNVNYQSNLIESVDPNYPEGVFGGDSQARWSWQVKAPGYSHDYTQDIALGINEATKQITLESWRPGWSFVFVTSSGFRTIDRRFTVPTQ